MAARSRFRFSYFQRASLRHHTLGRCRIIAILFARNNSESEHGLTQAHPAANIGRLAGSWIELGTEREGLFQVLDENAHFGGQPAAGRPDGNDWHCSLKGCEKPN